MERYRRVNSSPTTPPSCIKDNEIRITTQGLSGGYISYALSLFQDFNVSEVVLTAMGRAINKAVTLAEILKRRVRGLHQNISLSSSYVKDVWEPLEEGLERLEMVRHVSMISITLSVKELDVSSSGYQPPTVTKQVQPLVESNQGGGYGGPGRTYVRGRGVERRNVQPNNNGYHNAGDENWNPGRGEYCGRGGGYEASGRGHNKGFTQQGDRQGQNTYYSTAVTRRYNGGSTQTNIRRPNQPLGDANGYSKPGRASHQYSNGYSQGRHNSLAGDQNMTFQGQGRGSFGGRGRGRASRAALGHLNGFGGSWSSEGMVSYQRTYALVYLFGCPNFLRSGQVETLALAPLRCNAQAPTLNLMT